MAEKAEKVLQLVPPKLAGQVTKNSDPRFTPFREEIQRYWSLTNPGLDMPWDGSEAKRLNEWLKACPTVTLEQLQAMLSNRSRSSVVQSHRPRLWIQSLTDYANSPVDRYGKPVQQASEAQRRTDGQLEQLYAPAVEAVFAAKPTASVLQRALGVGYWEAVHLLDLMEARGVISAAADGGARSLLDAPEWLKGSMQEAVTC
jgi:hypothetical protein